MLSRGELAQAGRLGPQPAAGRSARASEDGRVNLEGSAEFAPTHPQACPCGLCRCRSTPQTWLPPVPPRAHRSGLSGLGAHTAAVSPSVGHPRSTGEGLKALRFIFNSGKLEISP